MTRWLVILVLLAAAAFAVNRIALFDAGPRRDGRRLVVETADLEFRFRPAGAVADSWMVFGGTDVTGPNAFSDAGIAGLPIQQARVIARRHPDFHLCRSPGAAQAKRQVETLTFIASGRAARRALHDAVALHEERMGSGGERTCITVRGTRLLPGSIRLADGGTDVTGEFEGAFEGQNLVLAEQAEVVDCRDLLR